MSEMTKQASFSELEYAAKKKQTRRDRFLAEIEAVTPWAVLERTIAPFYPILLKNSLDKPLAYRRNAIFSVLA